MRLLITRAEPDASRIAEQLQIMGHEVVLAPVAHCTPLPVEWPHNRPDGLVFTSRQAPALVMRDDLKHLRVLPIGKATAEAARAMGFTRVNPDAGGDRARLVDNAQGLLSLWWCCGTHLQGDLVSEMHRRGIMLERIPLYEMIAAKALPAAALSALKNQVLDAVVLMSAKTSERFIALLDSHEIDATWLRAVCLSEQVAAPLRAREWHTVAVAQTPDWHEMIKLLHHG